jgi:hypothetical protein
VSSRPETSGRRWGGQRLARRLAVAALLIICLLFISPWPVSLDGNGILAVAVVGLLGAALGIQTDWLAFRRNRSLDELRAGLRDRAYRLAYRIFCLFVVVAIPAIVIAAIWVDDQAAHVQDPIGGRRITALVLLLVLLPTAMIAWLQSDGGEEQEPEEMSTSEGRGWHRWAPAVLVPVLLGVWLVASAAGPASITSFRIVPDPNVGLGGGSPPITCGGYAVAQQRAGGFAALVQLQAIVCWNGKVAWVESDRGGPGPKSLRPSFGGSPVAPAFCSTAWDSTDFGKVADQRCRVAIESDGTVHVVLRARASSVVAGFGAHSVTLTLTVSRKGRVLSLS